MDENASPNYDFASLGIDTLKHNEVLTALTKLGVDQKSIKPTLDARELAVGEFAGTGIGVCTSTDERRLMVELGELPVISVHAVANMPSFEEASLVRTRMLNDTSPATFPVGVLLPYRLHPIHEARLFT